jgi:Ca2+:H+ antiporter
MSSPAIEIAGNLPQEAEVAAQRIANSLLAAPSHDVVSAVELLPPNYPDSSGTPTRQSGDGDEHVVLGMSKRTHSLNVFTIKKEGGHAEEKKPIPSFLRGSWIMFTNTKINLMLVFLPLGISAELLGWSDGAIFGLNCLAILPLAKLLGDATEQVAAHTNDTIGGLLNATFGNATELIVSVFALVKGLLGVVQVSLLGSIISNTLLVLGMACIAGGITQPVQKFNSTAASANTTLLLMAILGMSIPACLASLGQLKVSSHEDLMLSRMTAIILLGLYVLYIYFQLVTHRKYFEAPPRDESAHAGAAGQAGPGPLVHSNSKAIVVVEEEEEEVYFTLYGALFWLGAITVMIAFLSEFLTGAIEGATKDYNINQSFVGFVILPIVGNAAEHATAITMAYKSKMDLALGVALGSATQIALFVVPFMVLTGWAIGQPLDLFFGAYETAITFVATVVVGFAVADGETNWLEGASLLSAYVIIAMSFLFYEHSYAVEE